MHAVLYARREACDAINTVLAGISGLELTVCLAAQDAASAVATADVLLLPQSFYESDLEVAINASRSLRWVQLLSAGYEKLEKRNIPSRLIVTSAGPSFSNAVADHALALLLSLTRRMPQSLSIQTQERWDASAGAGAISLQGRTALIVGFGSIGQNTAVRLKAFGMTVFGVNRSGTFSAAADRMFTLGELDAALGEADVVIVALPQMEETKTLFDRKRFKRCKPGAIFINVGRGPTVDLEALEDVLNSRLLGGAGLDVTDPEPLPDGHPLWSTPNVIITPHFGGAGGSGDLAKFVAGNIAAFMRGQPVEPRIHFSAPIV